MAESIPIARLIATLEARFDKYEKSLATAIGSTDRNFKRIEARGRQLEQRLKQSASSAAMNVNRALGAIGIGLLFREVIRYADAWIEAGNKIKAAGQAAGVQVRSLDELKNGANAARTEFSTYVDLYARLIRSGSKVAESEEQIALATDLVSKALKAGGASAQEQTASLIQLGQAIGSGVLQGDELRSLRENAPLIAKAIADEFGVTIAGLKKLGEEGKLTSDRVFKAILNAQKPIEAQFKKTQATIGDAITRIGNEFTAYIGHADASTGASRQLVEALQYLVDNFKTVGDAVVQFATIMIGALTGRALIGFTIGAGRAVAALGVFLAALRAGTLTAATFTAALGPISLILGAAAAAIYIYSSRQDDAAIAAKGLADAIKASRDAMADGTGASVAFQTQLKSQISLQLAAARTALKEAEAQLAAARARNLDATRDTSPYPIKSDFNLPAKASAAIEGPLNKVRELDKQIQEAERELLNIENRIEAGVGKDGYGGGLPKTDLGKGKEKPFDREIRQIKERTAATQAETAAQAALNPLIDDYGYAVERARTEQDLLSAAKREGIKVTPQLRAQITSLADGYAKAYVDARKLAETQDEIRANADEMRSIGRDALGGFISDLRAGKTGADALASALDRVADRLWDMALDSLFNKKGIFGGASGGTGLFGGAIIPGILHKGGSAGRDGYGHGRSVPAAAFANAPRFHSGRFPGQRPNEIAAILEKDETVLPKGTRLRGGSMSINYAPIINAPNATADFVPAMAAALQENNRQWKKSLPSLIGEYRARGMI